MGTYMSENSRKKAQDHSGILFYQTEDGKSRIQMRTVS